MAGFAIGALPYFLQYQQQAQQQAQQKQEMDMRMAAFQQQQQDRQRQQAAMAAAGNALPQLLAQPPQPQAPQFPPQQTPAPGQPSQPMIQPGQVPPGSLGPGESQVNLPPLPPGMAGASTGAPGAPPLPPFKPMPTSPPPQQAAQPAAIPAPPAPPAATPAQGQGGPLSIQSAIKVLQDQGLQGADLMAGLAQLQPLLDSQAKAQAAQLQTQFNNEIKLQGIQDRHDALDERRREADQRAQDRSLDRADRLAARQDSLAIRHAMLDLSRQRLSLQSGTGAPAPENLKPDAQGNLPAPKGVSGYSSEAIKALGEDYAQRGSAAFTGMGRGKTEDAVRAAAINYGTAVNAQAGKNVATNKAQYTADTAGARSNAIQASKVDAAANALTRKGGIGDQFQQSIDALNRTGIPFANEAQMETLRKANDPRVAAYDTAQNGVVSEAAQILGRGTLTVNSMEEARRVVNGWKTSEAARAGLAQLKKEAATTTKASREEVARSAQTPKKPEVGEPVKISSDADYNALPSGAEFIAPDGSHRRKP